MTKEIYWRKYKFELHTPSLSECKVIFTIIAIGLNRNLWGVVFKNYFYFRILGFGFNIYWN